MNEAEFMLTAFFALFAVVDPPGNIPFYVNLTEGLPKVVRKRIIKKTVIVAAVTLLCFAFLGNAIFSVFGITIPAFRIAGGLLLLKIAFSMLQGEKPKTKQTKSEKEEALQKILRGYAPEDALAAVRDKNVNDPEVEAVAVVPLGIPLFAGPGGMTTAVLLVATAERTGASFTYAAGLVSIIILIIMLMSYVMLYYADPLFEKIGKTGSLAFSRIFGLILAAIAVQLIINGLTEVMTGWYREMLVPGVIV
ncbi:MAG: MarC family protein [Candidatus Thermoplasmatota archaeon]|nr:MarC family protein [Candidatus Thermoplasmatota archaeon]